MWLILLRQPATKHKFLVVFGDFGLVFNVFCRKLRDFRCFLQVICAAGGQQEHQTITQARSDKKLVRTAGSTFRWHWGQRIRLILFGRGGSFVFQEGKKIRIENREGGRKTRGEG